MLLSAVLGLPALGIILMTEDFLGQPFAENIEIAENWRRSVAHDYKSSVAL